MHIPFLKNRISNNSTVHPFWRICLYTTRSITILSRLQVEQNFLYLVAIVAVPMVMTIRLWHNRPLAKHWLFVHVHEIFQNAICTRSDVDHLFHQVTFGILYGEHKIISDKTEGLSTLAWKENYITFEYLVSGKRGKFVEKLYIKGPVFN